VLKLWAAVTSFKASWRLPTRNFREFAVRVTPQQFAFLIVDLARQSDPGLPDRYDRTIHPARAPRKTEAWNQRRLNG
jgi:hypothetical protein